MSDENQVPESDADLVDSIEQAMERLEAEATHWKDQAMRAAADAENTRRRAEREMNDARAYAIQRFAKDLLGVADNLERALLAAPKDAADPALKNLALGIEMTEKELLGAFERNGLKRVAPAKGEKFDPHLHQAMMEQPSDEVQAGGVLQVLQPGYELFGRIVRPAMVVVAARGAGEAQAANDAYVKAGAVGGETIDTKA